MKKIKYSVSKQYRNFGFLFVILISTSAFADVMHGIFMVVKGDISVLDTSQQKKKVKVGDKVFPGDMVESGLDARAKIVMADRNVINISPETKLEIKKYQNDGDKKNVEMNLLQGKVRNNVEQKYDGENNTFIVKTPTAVAGVRGTQFFTGFDPSTGITSVVTLRGAVTLAPVNVTGGKAKPVVVNKGESTSVSPGANPEPPKSLPKEELKKIDQESTASSGPSKQEGGKEVAKGEKSEKGDKSEKTDGEKNEGKESKSDSKSADSKGSDSKSSDSKGSESASNADQKPSDAKGADAKGADAKGADTKGSDMKSADAKGPEAKGPEAKGPDVKGPDSVGGGQPVAIDAKDTAVRAPAMAESPAASMANTPPAAPPKMIEVGDFDTGQFKEVKVPAADVNQPKRPPTILVNPNTPPPVPTTVVNDIVRGTMGKTRVIIVPVPPPPTIPKLSLPPQATQPKIRH